MLAEAEAPRQKLVSGWARSPRVLADLVAPQSEGEVGRLFEHPPPRGLIARAAGHSLGDAAQRAGGTVVSTLGLSALLEADWERGVVTVGAGMRLGDLMRTSVPHGWLPAALPSTRFVTVGGAIAADLHGRNHHRDGSFGAHVIGLRLATPAGTIALGPEREDELFWATVGGMGLTGVMLDATLQLSRIETGYLRAQTERAADLDDVMARMAAREAAHRYSVAWIDCLGPARTLGRGVVVSGNHARRADLRDGASTLRYSPSRSLSVPVRAPSGLLRAGQVRLVNELYHRRAPATPREGLQTLSAFFHAHDRLAGWPRLYGARGFLEYQFAVPFERHEVVPRTIERARSARCAPFLAIVKHLGGGTPGALSFPREGWMAAFDFPVRPRLAAVLHDLDEMVAEAGGRVYLAKDASLRPELVPAMYPGLAAWRDIRARRDPHGVMRSDLADRLGLV